MTDTGAAPPRLDPRVLGLAGQGRVFDLASGWWPGMPLAPGHPPFQVFTFRTPAGERAQGDLEFLAENRRNFGFISEVMSFTAHSGTHIDALAHITAGEGDTWFGGHSAGAELGDFGPLSMDASALPPLITRGVLIDAPAAAGRPALGAHQPIGADLVRGALERQRVELREGDVVLIRTGTMRHWPDTGRMAESAGSGIDLAAARLIAEACPAAVGADTATVEVQPSGVDGEPQPVHHLLIRDLGIPLLEWVRLEELAAAGVHEFLFLCLPLTVRGATGSLVRPVAVA